MLAVVAWSRNADWGTDMPRYVVLAHDHPVLHWDLMLERAGVLRTWRLAEAPRAGQAIRAEPIGDHRLTYLDYEGPVSLGRGTVWRCERGEFRVQVWSDDEVRVAVTTARGVGSFRLQRHGELWTFVYTCDGND